MNTLAMLLAATLGQPGASAPPAAPLDWATLESRTLRHQSQITFPDRFAKAGEAYFSPDGRWVIFQAVDAPAQGREPDPFYAMYVAHLMPGKKDKPPRLEGYTRVSPPGSANTCGWFHPKEPAILLFGSTLTHPADDQKSGFQVGTRKYMWMFPREMEVVRTLYTPLWEETHDPMQNYGKDAPGEPPAAPPAIKGVEPLFSRPNYDAECSYDPTGRFVLYAHIEDEMQMGRPDANIYVYDTRTNTHHALVVAPGYDGGPFFSPDGKSICYRSDRKGDDLLQLFVADLKFEAGADGVPVPVGITREYQLTSNEHVNWAPYWHPSGQYLVYGTSEVGHQNYEVFAVEVNKEAMAKAAAGAGPGTVLVPARRARITHADGADVLPVFSPDGTKLMWTSQRGPKAAGEAKASSQLWIADWAGNPFEGGSR
jgi:hypothetical protein